MPTRRSIALATLLLLAGCGQESSSSPTGRLVGRVVLSGLPPRGGLDVALAGPGTSLATTTGDDGTYEFTGLPGGDYTVTATVDSTLEGSASIVVNLSGGPVQAPDLVFTPVGDLGSCIVLLGLHNAVNQAVTVTAPDGSVTTSVTDATGCFALRALVPGDYVVAATIPFTFEGTQTRTVTVSMGGFAAANLLFYPYGDIVGRVVLNGLPPPAGVTVQVAYWALSSPTDSSGRYRIVDPAHVGMPSHLPPGTYTVTASIPSTAEGNVSVTTTVTMGDAQAPDLVFTPVGTLSGTVTLGWGAPASGALVWLDGTAFATLADATGGYAFTGLGLGAYRVAAVTSGYQQGTGDATVSWNTTTPVPAIDLQADPPGPNPTGTIAGSAAVAGLGLRAGILVQVDGTSLSATSGPGGSWRIYGVPYGAWSLTLSDGVRSEHVPNAVSLPGSDGYLLDGRLYPVGMIELQGAPRVCQDCSFVGVSSSAGLAVFKAGSRLLAATLDGGRVTELANDAGTDAYAMVQVTLAATPGTGCWVVYTTGTSTLQSVPCAGGTMLSITRLVPGTLAQFGPTGSTLIAPGSDGSIWFADLDRSQARPVFLGELLRYTDLGPDHVAVIDFGTGEFASVAYADGSVAILGKWFSTSTRAGVGGWIAVKESFGPPYYGEWAVAVGPPGGPIITIAASDRGVSVLSWGFSNDGTSLAVLYWDYAAQAWIMTVARSSDGAILWTSNEASPTGLLGWSPDSTRMAWPSTSGMRLTDLDGNSVSLPDCPAADFTPDGKYLACHARYSSGPASIYDVATGALVRAISAPLDTQWMHVLPDSSAFWFSDLKSQFYRLGVDGSFAVITDAAGINEPAPSAGGRWITYRSSGLPIWKAISTSGGGQPVDLNPPELAPVGLYNAIVPPTDAFVFASGGNVYMTPPGGGTPQLVGSTRVGPNDGPPAAIAPDGLSVSTVGPDGVLRSAWLPSGPSGVDATGVSEVEYIGGGRLAWNYQVGSPSYVGPPAGPLTPLGAYRNVDRLLGSDGRMVFQDAAGVVISVRMADADVIPLASCDVAGFPGAVTHDDRVAFLCGGVLHSVPIQGGATTPSVRIGSGTFNWIDDRHVAATRGDALPPYRFQNGLYLVTVP